MKDQVPENVKKLRSADLIELGDRMSQEFREFYLGKEEEVLFEEESVIDDMKYYVGYTKEYVKIPANSAVIIKSN